MQYVLNQTPPKDKVGNVYNIPDWNHIVLLEDIKNVAHSVKILVYIYNNWPISLTGKQ